MIGINPARLGITALTVAVVLVFFDLLVLALRIWARRIKKKQFDACDYLIVAAGIFAIVDMVIKGFEMRWGAGAHYTDVVSEKPEVLILLQKITYAQYFVWGITILLIKLSMLLLYRSLFHCMQNTLIAIYLCIAVCIGIWVFQIGVLFGSCKPLAYNWDPTIHGSCYFTGISEWVISMSLNFAMDVALVILPIPEVWRMRHVPVKKKIGISLMFGLGILTCILVGLRFKYLLEMDLMDGTHDGVPSGILSSVELYLGVIVACLPLLPPAFLQMEKRVQKSYIGGLLPQKISKNSPQGDTERQAADEAKEPDYDHIELSPWP